MIRRDTLKNLATNQMLQDFQIVLSDIVHEYIYIHINPRRDI